MLTAETEPRRQSIDERPVLGLPNPEGDGAGGVNTNTSSFLDLVISFPSALVYVVAGIAVMP